VGILNATTKAIAVRNSILASAGWICLVLFVAAVLGGRGKTAVDYAGTSLEPLAEGQAIRYDDRRHALWSGWQAPSPEGFRYSNAASPDILFRATKPARDCTAIIAAFPLLVGTDEAQRVEVVLNGVEAPESVFVRKEGVFRAAHVGDLVEGVNVLSLRLPDAGRAVPIDEHVLALGLRSVEFECAGAP
jgi:hypothetical protein